MSGAQRRKFSEEEKRIILSEASSKGVNIVLREKNLSYSVFAKWKQKFALADGKGVPATKLFQRIRELTAENDRLKKLVANLALELQMKKDMRKK